MVDQGQGSINGPGWSEPDDEPKAVLPRATAFFGCRWTGHGGAGGCLLLRRSSMQSRPFLPLPCVPARRLSLSDAAAASLSIASCPPRACSQHSNPVPSRLSPSSCPLSFVRFVSPVTVVRQRGACMDRTRLLAFRSFVFFDRTFVRSFVNAARSSWFG